MPLDRVPPHDLEAERSALNVLLSRGRMPDEFDLIESATFYEPVHAQIWAAAQSLLVSGYACDAVAVNSALIKAGRHSAARRLIECVSGTWTADPESLARVLLDAAGRRHLIHVVAGMEQDAYYSEDDYETILERAEHHLAGVPTESRDDVTSLMPISEFVGLEAPQPDWVIPNLLARGERMILTGEEGLGKSTLIRQIGMCGAAGVEPFDGREIPRLKVLMIDVENPLYILQKRMREIRQALYSHSSNVNLEGMWIDRRPEGMDLGLASDRRWLARRMRAVNPDLLVIGPAYKLHQTANEDKDEVIARTITSVLDDIRGECALVLEHHAGNEQQGGQRPVRPFGSSLWRRWPEFGYGLRWQKPGKGVTPKQAEERRVADFVAWRGARDERAWPRIVESGGTGLPWVESEGYAS